MQAAMHSSRWKAIGRALIVVGVAIGVGWLLLALAGTFHHKTPSAVAEPPTRRLSGAQAVDVVSIRRPRFETAIGTIEPVHEAAVASKLLARVVEVRVKAGQAVTRDEVLVRLDDAELVARQQQALAAERGAVARDAQATADLARSRELRKQKVVTQAELDQAEATQRSAAAELDRIRQTIREAEVLLEYATIRSPLTGTVIDKRVESGDTVSPGQILLTLYDPTHMQMVASVRESLAMRLKVGQELPARLESLGYECHATVSEIVPEAQAASRSFTVKVIGPCPPGVYSGMFGRLLLPLEDEDLTVIPARAVRRVGQLTMVDVVLPDDRLERRSIQIGREIDRQYEVLSGLTVGERVAVPAAGETSSR
jgi:RND family efflux transporter MFP subunit